MSISIYNIILLKVKRDLMTNIYCFLIRARIIIIYIFIIPRGFEIIELNNTKYMIIGP